MHIPISQRYALAIYDLCKKNGWLGKVYEDFKNLDHLLEISEEFKDYIVNPAFDHVKRAEFIQKLFQKNINEVTLNMLLFVEEKKHLAFLSEILTAFLDIYRKEHNIVKVKIISSAYLNQDKIDSICEQLNRKFQKRIEYDLIIDASLIGGLKIIVGDLVYDFSFKSQLNRFKNKILNHV